MTGPDISISIVNGNRPEVLLPCLESIHAHTSSVTYEVHLVAHNYDPGKLAELLRRWPGLVIHPVQGIRGYSQNHNVGLRAARGRYVAILNDDTILESDLFGEIVRFLDSQPSIAGVSPVLRNRDGTLQMGLRGRFTPLTFIVQQFKLDRLVPTGWAERLGLLDRPHLPATDGVVDIQAGTGACFVARREAIESIGFLDELYFFGPDDIDWTVRLRRQAGRVVLLPHLSLIHLCGVTTGAVYHAILPTVYAGCYTFFRRYHGPGAEWGARLILGVGLSAVLAAGWGAAWAFSRSDRAGVLMRARWNCVRFAFSSLSSPEVFAQLRRRA
jgi:GT2 family glycosyltransferase